MELGELKKISTPTGNYYPHHGVLPSGVLPDVKNTAVEVRPCRLFGITCKDCRSAVCDYPAYALNRDGVHLHLRRDSVTQAAVAANQPWQALDHRVSAATAGPGNRQLEHQPSPRFEHPHKLSEVRNDQRRRQVLQDDVREHEVKPPLLKHVQVLTRVVHEAHAIRKPVVPPGCREHGARNIHPNHFAVVSGERLRKPPGSATEIESALATCRPAQLSQARQPAVYIRAAEREEFLRVPGAAVSRAGEYGPQGVGCAEPFPLGLQILYSHVREFGCWCSKPSAEREPEHRWRAVIITT